VGSGERSLPPPGDEPPALDVGAGSVAGGVGVRRQAAGARRRRVRAVSVAVARASLGIVGTPIGQGVDGLRQGAVGRG
jgi:hypothetical protein